MDEQSILLNRLGIGARPGQRREDVAAAFARSLQDLSNPATFAIDVDGLPNSLEVAALFAEYKVQQRNRKAVRVDASSGVTSAEDSQRADMNPSMDDMNDKSRLKVRKLLASEIAARMNHGLTTENGFQERLVWFWSNHFSVSAKNIRTLPFVGPFEREVIRQNLTGSFGDLLLAVTKHPAMLLYLDQAGSIGPNSRIGKRRKAGLNENLGREILELHTLGVQGGYSQEDVTEFARALTGWTIVSPRRKQVSQDPSKRLGEFQFLDMAHEPGRRTVLGKSYSQQREYQAEAILLDLSLHASTARHIATKLAKHFVADDPPLTAIEKLEHVFLSTGGDLPSLHRAVATLSEIAMTTPEKLKSPNEFVVSSARALGIQSLSIGEVRAAFTLLGSAPFAAPSPEGWPDDAANWAAPDGLMKRLEWAQTIVPKYKPRRDPEAFAEDALGAALSEKSRLAIRRAETDAQGFVLTLMSPEFQRR